MALTSSMLPSEVLHRLRNPLDLTFAMSFCNVAKLILHASIVLHAHMENWLWNLSSHLAFSDHGMSYLLDSPSSRKAMCVASYQLRRVLGCFIPSLWTKILILSTVKCHSNFYIMPAPKKDPPGLVQHLNAQAPVKPVNNILSLSKYFQSADLLLRQVSSYKNVLFDAIIVIAHLHVDTRFSNICSIHKTLGWNISSIVKRRATLCHADEVCKVRVELFYLHGTTSLTNSWVSDYVWILCSQLAVGDNPQAQRFLKRGRQVCPAEEGKEELIIELSCCLCLYVCLKLGLLSFAAARGQVSHTTGTAQGFA